MCDFSTTAGNQGPDKADVRRTQGMEKQASLQGLLDPRKDSGHSSTLAWKIPWTEEPGGLQSMGLLESDTTE